MHPNTHLSKVLRDLSPDLWVAKAHPHIGGHSVWSHPEGPGPRLHLGRGKPPRGPQPHTYRPVDSSRTTGTSSNQRSRWILNVLEHLLLLRAHPRRGDLSDFGSEGREHRQKIYNIECNLGVLGIFYTGRTHQVRQSKRNHLCLCLPSSDRSNSILV
jgi:hypothetical protein